MFTSKRTAAKKRILMCKDEPGMLLNKHQFIGNQIKNVNIKHIKLASEHVHQGS